MIQTIIGDVVAQLVVAGSSPATAPTYIHGWQGWKNLKADEIQNDIVFLDEPVSSDDVFIGNILKEQFRLVVHLYTKSELEFTPDQHLPLLEAMRLQRKKFLDILRRDERVRAISNIRTIDMMNALDVNLTGVILQFTIEPLDDLSLC